MSTHVPSQGASRHQSEPALRERFQALNSVSSRQAAALAAQGKRAGVWGLLFAPLLTFLRTYCWRGEWRCGVAGLITALFSAYAVFVCYAKLWEIHHSKSAPPPPKP